MVTTRALVLMADPGTKGLRSDRIGGRSPEQTHSPEPIKGVETVASFNSSQPVAATERLVEVGGYVAVRTRYVGTWSNGFEVAAHVDRGCLIRRLSDGSVLPDVFQWTEIRPASRARDVA
jgi:hypothetical protein